MHPKTKHKRYSLRWPTELHELAEKAAVIKEHKSLKSYLIELVEKDAKKTVEDYSTIKVTTEEFDRFVKTIEKQGSKIKE